MWCRISSINSREREMELPPGLDQHILVNDGGIFRRVRLDVAWTPSAVDGNNRTHVGEEKRGNHFLVCVGCERSMVVFHDALSAIFWDHFLNLHFHFPITGAASMHDHVQVVHTHVVCQCFLLGIVLLDEIQGLGLLLHRKTQVVLRVWLCLHRPLEFISPMAPFAVRLSRCCSFRVNCAQGFTLPWQWYRHLNSVPLPFRFD